MQPPTDYVYSSDAAKEWFSQPIGEWADNSLGNCQICNVHFNLLPIGYYCRHHCRKCGKLICQNCSMFPPGFTRESMNSHRHERFCVQCSVSAAAHFGENPLVRAAEYPAALAVNVEESPATVTIDIDAPAPAPESVE